MRPALSPSLAGLLAGALAALVVRAEPRYAAEPRPVAYWAADRSGDRLFGLDRDLLPVREIEVRAPLEVEAAPGGGAWVLSAAEGSPRGAHRLRRILSDGTCEADVRLGPAFGLTGASGGAMVVIERGRGASDRVLRVGRDGRTRLLAELPGLGAASARHGLLLLGSVGGEVWLFRDRSADGPIAHRAFGGPIETLAPGARAGTWWVLAAGELVQLGHDLSPTWRRGVPAAEALAPDPASGGVWLTLAGEGGVQRYGSAGELELHALELPLRSLSGGLGRPDGSILFVTPGAILHLDARARLAPGQGGFDFLIDLAAAGDQASPFMDRGRGGPFEF